MVPAHAPRMLWPKKSHAAASGQGHTPRLLRPKTSLAATNGQGVPKNGDFCSERSLSIAAGPPVRRRSSGVTTEQSPPKRCKKSSEQTGGCSSVSQDPPKNHQSTRRAVLHAPGPVSMCTWVPRYSPNFVMVARHPRPILLSSFRTRGKDNKEFNRVLQRAKNEGVLLAEENPNGQWFVLHAGAGVKRQTQSSYYCHLCSKYLDEDTLESHLDGFYHKKNNSNAPSSTSAATCSTLAIYSSPAVLWSQAEVSGAGYSSSPPNTHAAVCSRSANFSSVVAAGMSSVTYNSEDWQEIVEEGCYKCKLCNKICDATHETSKDHIKRLEAWRYYQKAKNEGYPAPKQPFLAWVPDENNGDGKYLRCLLCKKWIADWESTDTANYRGMHGDSGPANQKEHGKKLSSYGYYAPEVAEEREKHHPTRRTTQPARRNLVLPVPGWTDPAQPGPAQPHPRPPAPAGRENLLEGCREENQKYSIGVGSGTPIPSESALFAMGQGEL